jgi:hypothetical protein
MDIKIARFSLVQDHAFHSFMNSQDENFDDTPSVSEITWKRFLFMYSFSDVPSKELSLKSKRMFYTPVQGKSPHSNAFTLSLRGSLKNAN